MTGRQNVYNAAWGSNRLPALAGQIYAEHNAAIAAATSATQHAINCGALLIEAKAGLEHGQWLPWVQDNCPFSERTAQAYMRLAEKVSGFDEQEAQRVADLPVRDAVRAVADSRDDKPLLPDRQDGLSPEMRFAQLYEWAERQTKGPFNEFDFQNPSCLRNKLLQQTKVPPEVSMALSIDENREWELPPEVNVELPEFPPMLPQMPDALLIESVRCLIRVAENDVSGLDIDFEDTHVSRWLPHSIAEITVTAACLAGTFLAELKRRSALTSGGVQAEA